MDRHETIVTGRCETFRYCHIGDKGMTSAELKHRVKLQEWAARIQDCRSSGLSVRAWALALMAGRKAEKPPNFERKPFPLFLRLHVAESAEERCNT